jgi:hypothetical protein
MGLAVHISREKELELGTFVAEEADIYFEKPSVDEENALRPIFSKKNTYYVGSSSGCSCGFLLDSADFNDTELVSGEDKKSPHKLIDFLNAMTEQENIEFDCCWGGYPNLPIKNVE